MHATRRITFALLLATATTLASWAYAAEEKAWFGLAFSVETEGFSFNPTIQSAKVDSVVPASPAAGAGISPGDVVLAVQGIAIAGAKADVLKAAMKKSVGETLRLKIKRGDAEPREVQMVGVTKPVGG